MERSSIFFDNNYPGLCMVKSALFIIVTIAVLYLPLGDPDVECERRRVAATNQVNATMCCLCNLYKLLIKTTNAIVDIVEMMMCLVIEALYEAKLKFYSMLEAVDRYDLCRTVSCGKDADEADANRRRPCSCSKKKVPN